MKLPIITSAPHESDDFGDFLDRVKLTDWQIGEFSDKYTADTAFHPNALGNLRSKASRGLAALNRTRDFSLLRTEDFHGNPIWKEGEELTDQEKEFLYKTYYDPYHNEIKKLIGKSKSHGFKKIILWDQHDTGDFHQETGERNRRLPEGRVMPEFILSNFGQPHTGKVDPTIGYTSSPPWFIKKIQEKISKIFNIEISKIEINTLFKGGFITEHYGKPQNDYGNIVFAIQIEYNRGLIMNQLTRKPYLDKINDFNKKFNKVMEYAVKILNS